MTLHFSFRAFRPLTPRVEPAFCGDLRCAGQGISIGSQRNFSNSFIVDGLSDNDDAAGLTGAFYGLDVVKRVAGRHFRRPGGVRTRAGRLCQRRHQERDQRSSRRRVRLLPQQPLQCRQCAFQRGLPLTQAQYGASLGGPIIHDRTFYFANFEQRHPESIRPGHHLARERSR